MHKAGIEALEQLNLGSVRKLQLARIHNIPQWIKPELTELAARDTVLTVDEAKQIGVEFTAILLILLDKALRSPKRVTYDTYPVHRCYKCKKCTHIYKGPRFSDAVSKKLNVEIRKRWNV